MSTNDRVEERDPAPEEDVTLPWEGHRLPAKPPSELLRALRPREKMLARGATSLSSAELVALVLGSGTVRQPAAVVADRLVRKHGLKGLASLEPESWLKERGIGKASAARLAAVFETGRRVYGRDPGPARPRLTRPSEVWRLTRDLAAAKKECLAGLYLDAQNGLLHRETLSVGSLNTTRTHPREILYPAIVHLALGFILAHNHPSGCLEPSDEDVAFTRGVQRAGELMGIELYDHVIVTREGYTSLRERGVL